MDKIVLGSGALYVVEFNGTIPENTVFEVEANRLGEIKGGATLEYKCERYDATDDFGKMSKSILTKEEAILKSGIMTWCGETLKKLCGTCRVTESEGKRTVKIGGIANNDGKRYAVRFLHKDVKDGDIRVTIVGQNQTGFTLAFVKDKETVIDASFKAEPNDDEGTLIVFEETIPKVKE